MKALIVLGSSSDLPAVAPLAHYFKANKIQYELHVCSAHRTPDELDALLKRQFTIIIAGAGLAAHLPGVCAAKTIAPVVGIPCRGAFDGLDAFLSIAQMPPHIPVLGMSVHDKHRVDDVAKLLRVYTGVTIIGDTKNKRVQSCVEVLTRCKVPFVFSDNADTKKANIYFFPLGEYKTLNTDALIINVALKENSAAQDALSFCHSAQHGFWVGINRGENAALSVIEILNHRGAYTLALKNYREELKKKILDEDTQLQQKV